MHKKLLQTFCPDVITYPCPIGSPKWRRSWFHGMWFGPMGVQATRRRSWTRHGHGSFHFWNTNDEVIMMTSSNGTIFRVTGHLCGDFTGHRWIPHTKASDPALMFSLICSLINGWINNRETGDLRRHRAHYDVVVMRHCGIQLWYIPRMDANVSH